MQVVDTTERDRAVAELDREREARRNAELEAAKVRMSHQLVLNECNQLRQEVERQRQQLELIRSDLWDLLSSEECYYYYYYYYYYRIYISRKFKRARVRQC